MSMLKNKRTQDYIFILLLAIIAYWPVSFMIFSVKNDAINYFMALRYNTSEAIQNGIFPLWSPYINMGYPVHGDMQAGVWNPIVLLLSIFRKYDIYWLQVETIITIIISGLSMYHLLRHFKLDRAVVLSLSAAYMLSGYITDAGQFLNWLYAASFLPLVFLFALRSFESFKAKDSFLLGLSCTLMLLCAYPADFILVSYFIAALILFLFFSRKKNNSLKTSASLFTKQIVIAGISFLVLSLPALLSYLPFISSINRGNGVSLDDALSNSLSPVNLISFLTPWPTQRITLCQYTDPLIRNCYMGIISLIFFIFYFFYYKEKTQLQKFLIGAFIFFFVFSLGKLGIIRVAGYYLLPFMDSFRHPANAKLFFIFAGQLLTAFALNRYLAEPETFRFKIIRITNSLLLMSVILLVTGMLNSDIGSNLLKWLSDPSLPGRDIIKNAFTSTSFSDFLLLNSLFLILTLVITRKFLNKNLLKKYLVLIICAEMTVVAQLMLPLTYVRMSPPSVAQSILNAQPAGYPVPALENTIEEYSIHGMKYFDEIGCLNPYNKKPGRSDYVITPANLSTQESFWDYSTFKNKIIKYPLFYFADTIYKIKDTAIYISSSSSQKAAIVNLPFEPGNNTSLSHNSISVLRFLPGTVELNTKSSNAEFLVFLQNDYKNWEASINGKKVPIYRTNLAFMGLYLPAGNNQIKFKYNADYIKFSAITPILFLILGLLYFNRKEKNEQKNN